MQKRPDFATKLQLALGDRQREAPAALCARCGGEVYRWEMIYFLDGDVVCEDCLYDYAQSRFAPQHRRLAELLL